MDFGLVLGWTSKTLRELVFISKFNNEIKLEMVWFISNEFYDLWTFIWWKISTFSQSPFHFEKNDLVWNFASMF